VSFQVIAHLEDAGPYVTAIAELLQPDGVALITTPNRLSSDGVNPYHVHEYEADELAERLRERFASVEMRGVGTSERVRRILEQRSTRIRRIMRLDPLRIRERVPRPLLEWLFARFAVLVRRRAATPGPADAITWRDFPVGPAADDCIDLLAVCRQPR
jgi:SAM-dependent methyltransferase